MQTNIESSIETINIRYYRKRQKLKVSVSTKPSIEFFNNIEYRTSTRQWHFAAVDIESGNRVVGEKYVGTKMLVGGLVVMPLENF